MRLSEVIRKYRLMSEKTVRGLASEIGISAATLSRVENGDMMDGRTLTKILVWMMQVTEEMVMEIGDRGRDAA